MGMGGREVNGREGKGKEGDGGGKGGWWEVKCSEWKGKEVKESK